MILDSRLLSGDFAITNTASSTFAVTTVPIDLAAVSGAGGSTLSGAAYQPNWSGSPPNGTVVGENGKLMLRVVVAGTGITGTAATTLNLRLVTADSDNLTTGAVTLVDSGSITVGTSTNAATAAGALVMQVAVPALACKRYLGIQSVVGSAALTSAAASRTINVQMGLDLPSIKKYYADNVE